MRRQGGRGAAGGGEMSRKTEAERYQGPYLPLSVFRLPFAQPVPRDLRGLLDAMPDCSLDPLDIKSRL